MTKEYPNNNIGANILENSKLMEDLIAAQLNMINKHSTTIGNLRETIWQEMFKKIIPKKFIIVHSVFIIDSNNNVSHEVDLAIMDEMYTPYIFQHENMKFVPIEAVAVVIECKSSSQDKDSLIKWSEAIKALETCPENITRTANFISFEAPKTQPATRPIQILCRLNNDSKEDLKKYFDCIISVVDSEMAIHFNKDDLYSWFKELNIYNKPDDLEKNDKEKLQEKKLSNYVIEGHPLLSLNFQLNQLLMLINNPMPFPHLAYAKMFNEIAEKTNEKEDE
jgi:hypothetical protein